MDKNGMEIERKYLIKRFFEKIEGETVWDIVQTYLVRSSPQIQRRVRKITVNGSETKYFYTEKNFLRAGVREEKEREISSEEYEKYLTEADKELTPIIKTRRIFDYKGQNFEMDEYPFSDELASVELELENENDGIELPPFLTVIKEVTSDSRYSNAAMALANKFPEDIKTLLNPTKNK